MARLDDLLDVRPTPRSRLRRWAGAPALLVAAGVVAATVGVPVVAAGVAARTAADAYLALPQEFPFPDLAQRSQIVAADGSHLAWLYADDRVRVPLADVPQHVQDAVVAVEDARFFEHSGVDVEGVARAAVRNLSAGDVLQGGSSLTQQYVKNALLAGAETDEQRQLAGADSLPRKLREAKLAVELERLISKEEILQRYLNIAYFGSGAHGVASAANRYFGVPVSGLTVAQGATLAGLLSSPNRLSPLNDPDASLARRDLVLRRMADAGLLTAEQRDAAAGEPLGLSPVERRSGCAAPGVVAPFFCDYVRRALEDTPLGAALGETREERQQRLLTGGLTIRTTLQPAAQDVAQTVLAQTVPSTDPSGVAMTYTAVEPGTGAVTSLAVNRRYGQDRPGYSRVNLALGGSSGMQAGSTFKPFVLAAALEQGIPLSTTVTAPARYTSEVFTTCEAGQCGLPYTVANAGDSPAGRHDLVSATHGSVNTAYLQFLERTGVEQPAQIAERLGLRQFVAGGPRASLHRGGSFVLGVNEVSPLALTAAYATFAASGTYCPPRPVTEVLDSRGRPVPLPAQQCRRALEPEIADTVAGVLRGTVDGPLPGRTARRADIGRPVAGKTGSTNSSTAAWFVGFTPQLAAAVWAGTPVPTPLVDVVVGGQAFRQVYGGTLPAPVWRDIVSNVLEDEPVRELPDRVVSDPQPVEQEARERREPRRRGAEGLASGAE